MLRVALGLLLCGCADLAAETIVPSDISVTLTADPSVDLQPGQRVTFTISVTNNGPEPADGLVLSSSPIYDELDVYTASSDCDGNVILAVVDLEDSFYFLFTYYPTSPALPPMAVGQTRICHLSLDYTPWAPSVFPVTFDSRFEDLDASNNSATVNLQRAVAAAPSAVPTLSSIWLGLLGCLLTATVAKSRTPASCCRPGQLAAF